jgi:hypothetical protein
MVYKVSISWPLIHAKQRLFDPKITRDLKSIVLVQDTLGIYWIID